MEFVTDKHSFMNTIFKCAFQGNQPRTWFEIGSADPLVFS